MNTRPLSKTQYATGVQCPKALWLYRETPELRGETDDFQQNLMDSGTAFGAIARQRWPGGVLIEADHLHPEDALNETQKALQKGATILYEAAFQHDGVLVRVDVLVKDSNGAWDICEAKAATKVEPHHLHDAAIQTHVLNGAGVIVGRTNIVHANPGYVRQGALDMMRLFTVQDVSREIAGALSVVPATLAHLKRLAAIPQPPEVSIGDHCSKPYPCPFKDTVCWKDVPKYSVFNIPYAKMEKKLELYKSGVVHVHQVDVERAGLTDKRSVAAVQTARLSKPSINVAAIQKFLAGLAYPLTHMDFETANPAVPPYDGLSPYSQMPFQASLKIQMKPRGPIVEVDFIGDGLSDPRAALAAFLSKEVPTSGTVLAYYKPFEDGRLKELLVHTRIAEMEGIRARLQDLADPFSKNWYTHPGFLGKWSLKNVAPVLYPGMRYKDLAIKNGTEAMAAYAEMADPATTPERRAFLIQALKAYCGTDTEAMVRILEHLYETVGGGGVVAAEPPAALPAKEISSAVKKLIQDARNEQNGGPLECREASPLSISMYIPCAKPATKFILSERGMKVYPMCFGCAYHNVNNRGAEDLGPVEA